MRDRNSDKWGARVELLLAAYWAARWLGLCQALERPAGELSDELNTLAGRTGGITEGRVLNKRNMFYGYSLRSDQMWETRWLQVAT